LPPPVTKGVVEEGREWFATTLARGLRIGDGPDEVYLRQIFRTEQAPAWSIAQSPYAVPYTATPLANGMAVSAQPVNPTAIEATATVQRNCMD